jgi:hypothetical protein
MGEQVTCIEKVLWRHFAVIICVSPFNHLHQLRFCTTSSCTAMKHYRHTFEYVPVIVSPSSLATRFRSRTVILPLPSTSNKLNTLVISSRLSLSVCKDVMTRCRERTAPCVLHSPFLLSSYPKTLRNRCCHSRPYQYRLSFDCNGQSMPSVRHRAAYKRCAYYIVAFLASNPKLCIAAFSSFGSMDPAKCSIQICCYGL